MNRTIHTIDLKAGAFLEYKADPGRFIRIGPRRFRSKCGNSQKTTYYYQVYDHNGIMIQSRMSKTELRAEYRLPLPIPAQP